MLSWPWVWLFTLRVHVRYLKPAVTNGGNRPLNRGVIGGTFPENQAVTTPSPGVVGDNTLTSFITESGQADGIGCLRQGVGQAQDEA